MKKKVLVTMAAALMLNVMNVSVYAEIDKTIEKSFEDTETIKKVQELLSERGYSCGEPDGIAGQSTTNAIIQYKTVNGRERAEEIVNYCLDNTIEFCVVDNMRIHLTYRNDTADPFYRLHVEY